MSIVNNFNRRIDAQISVDYKNDGSIKKRKEKSLPPKDKKQANEILDLLWQQNQVLSLCCLMQSLTGLRYSDASWLKYSDFYDEFGKLKPFFDLCQQKSFRMRIGRKRAKPMTQSDAFRKSLVRVYTNEAIEHVIADCKHLNPHSELLFPNSRSRVLLEDGTVIERPMSVDSADWHLNKVKRQLKLGFTLGTHSWRKFFALMLVRKGASLEKIRDLLGHDNIVSTNSYLHSFIDDVEQYTKTLRLDLDED